MQAVGELVTQGYDPEVIDLISLKPFDLETIYNSIKKTRKVLIVEECMKTGGIGASLSSTIGENFIDELDHEVVRLSSQDVPTAYAHELEAATIVQVRHAWLFSSPLRPSSFSLLSTNTLSLFDERSLFVNKKH